MHNAYLNYFIFHQNKVDLLSTVLHASPWYSRYTINGIATGTYYYTEGIKVLQVLLYKVDCRLQLQLLVLCFHFIYFL
jgi:hypothetical protein